MTKKFYTGKYLNNFDLVQSRTGIQELTKPPTRAVTREFNCKKVMIPPNPFEKTLDYQEWIAVYGHGYLRLSYHKIADIFALGGSANEISSVTNWLKNAASKLGLSGHKKADFVKWASENPYDRIAVPSKKTIDPQSIPARPEVFKQLSPYQWKVFYLCGCMKLETAETAQIMQITKNDVSDAMHILAKKLGHKSQENITRSDFIIAAGQAYMNATTDVPHAAPD